MFFLTALFAVITPRLVAVLIWLLTDLWSQAFNTWIWPVLGFIFLPVTTLVVLGALTISGAIEGYWIILLILAVMWDVGEKGVLSRS